ncbi:glycosyltransferase [Lacticaseibacillus nasuensis]|uniref:glycosyltransferase n=1 Tax=Lacticaseibacillus nasuensis TaxID=944671 RepID=UPI00224843AE|nr:glycosyltransferase [Lacticaseibacillus nasuensis]MCX2456209.1 glycosyltransferase [Lacticaseibacillus nasuensis]
MRIAILGFNLFAPGGTTRSNLNLLHDFAHAGDAVTYINYLPFSNRQLKQLKRAEQGIESAAFKRFGQIKRLTADVLMITRESFLPLVPWLRQRYPGLKIIAEIHTALPLFDVAKVAPYLKMCDGVRVATRSIQQTLKTQWGIENTYVQTVSLSHLSRIEFHPVPKVVDGTVALYLVGRYDDGKDISYAITLISSVIHQVPEYSFRLTLIGYGPLRADLQKQIDSLGLHDQIHLVTEGKRSGICLSTSRVESLGYTIAEAFAAGNPVAVYGGDDQVILENYQRFGNCIWLTKNIKQDTDQLVTWLGVSSDQAVERRNLALLEPLENRYVSTFREHLKQLSPPAVPSGVFRFRERIEALERLTYGKRLDVQHRLVYAMRAIPGLRELL